MRKNFLRIIILLIILAVIVKAVPPVNIFVRENFPIIVLDWLAEEPIERKIHHRDAESTEKGS